MKILFSFTVDTEDPKGTIVAGNISVNQALGIVQQLAVAEATQAAMAQANKAKEDKDNVIGDSLEKECDNVTTGLPKQSEG